ASRRPWQNWCAPSRAERSISGSLDKPHRSNDSTYAYEWVFDEDSGDGLSRIEIFRQNSSCAALDSRRHNQRVPKSDLGCILDLEGGSNLSCCCLQAPRRVGGHNRAG